MRVLDAPTNQARPTPQPRLTPAMSFGLATLGVLIGVGWLWIAPHWLALLITLGSLSLLLGQAWTSIQRTERERTVLAQAHSALDSEYNSIQTDYATLERAYEDLQQSHQRLQRRIDERTAERDQSTNQLQTLLDDTRSYVAQLTALNEVSVALNATLDRDEVLACILRQLERVVTFDSASVQQLEDDELQVIAARGMNNEVYDLRISVPENELARRVVGSPGPVVLGDVRKDPSFVMQPGPIRSWIGVALRVGERTVGILTIDSHRENAYTADDGHLVANFANQAALALHNSHLFAAAERRATEMALLLEMTRTVGSTLHLPEVLLRAAAAIGEALHAEDVLVLLLDEQGERLTPQAGAMGDHNYLRMRWANPTSLSNEPTLAKVIKQGCARVIHAVSPTIPYQTLLALPLSIKEQVLGVVLVATPDRDAPFGPQQLVLAEGLATSAAIAIEQARLYDQARRAAQAEERSRLARELHDSVTQTLFSMTLTAEAARAQVERNPVRAATQIDRLKAAAHQSLGEMRELLLQLRPTPLQEHGIIKSLHEHIASLNAQDVAINLECEGEDSVLTPSHAAGLYRIAQEAISNALRHAQATNVRVSFSFASKSTTLMVKDNGCGFDPDLLERSGRHLGLTSMSERAGELGGTLDVDSVVGEGTCLTVHLHG
ncbi:GAF domain-containing protein [Herpetosiphon llansteffanensis]